MRSIHGSKGDFALEASEWFFGSGDGIEKIVSYYNVGQVSYPEVDPED